jgi:hypothetical protein
MSERADRIFIGALAAFTLLGFSAARPSEASAGVPTYLPFKTLIGC